ANGKCYKCNSDRGSDCYNDWLWIYDFNSANIGWWYKEVDCETGLVEETEEFVGQCPVHPLKKVPNDPQNACFAANGKCYKCNSDRGNDCYNDWLWIYEFNSANIGWWYEEVDCYDPFEEEDNLVCPDGSVLYRKTADSENLYFNEKLEENQKFQIKYFYFDALGRSMKKKNVSRVKQIPYVKSRLNRDTSIELTSGSMFNVLLKTVNGHISALTSATFIYSTECSNEDYVPLNITIILSTPEDGIKVYLEGNDDDLKNHEQKHKSIYIEYGNDSWIESTTIPRRMTMKSVCEKIKNDYWVSIESKFRIMLNLQNAWDDEDENNVSHERIDVNREVENLKKQWFNSKCEGIAE
ncbi:MAG: hypothetical protein J6A06_08415, partial [Fibrobacteraceae bacterium]|nr:hypothetical protein [Fibrobacteraceae bacterium]